MGAFDSLSQSLTIPDLWQQEALRALREGFDVVVQAPTGAGKTYVFELFYPALRGQAVFTVPTRALANDKLAEWQRRGWDVGISTGDVARRLDAKVVVATLETQKARLLKRQGPALLVIDEYQMIGDEARGVNYELAIALAPAHTQLLLFSGSVANPQDVVRWLERIGRRATLVSHLQRPVPLEEVDLWALPDRAPTKVRDEWPRLMFNALRAGLGPILLFAPRRKAAEDLARQLAGALPPDRPLSLSLEQRQLAGAHLARLLEARVSFHHSGLSYAQRAGLIEPLAKAGELRVVVATMGLAAGINFSMRSVAITGTGYKAGNFEREVQPDELLQMFGRAGRRGLDDAGYALVTSRPPRLLDARARQLRRSEQVDWPALIAVMQAAVETGADPMAAVGEAAERLFSVQRVLLGVEHAQATGPMPCAIRIDEERARFARRGAVEMLNSEGHWETRPEAKVESPLGEVLVYVAKEGEGKPSPGQWRSALTLPSSIKALGVGSICRLPPVDGVATYGREIILGTRRNAALVLAPMLKKALKAPAVDFTGLETLVLGRVKDWAGGGKLARVFPRGEQLVAQISFAEVRIGAWIDSAGRPLLDPPERRVLPAPCREGVGGNPCPQLCWCQEVAIGVSPAYAWRRLGLIEPDGRPTRRGVMFSFFQHGEGLAIAAALEDGSYPVEELVFDLANLRAGPRFAGDDSHLAGRLAVVCQTAYERADFPGYLEMGVPPDYGAGAGEAVRLLVREGVSRQSLLTESLRMGDLERAVIEWRSLLRQIAGAPGYDWDRWRALKVAVEKALQE